MDFFDNVNCSTTVEEKIFLCILYYIIINFIQIVFGNYETELVSYRITIGDCVP